MSRMYEWVQSLVFYLILMTMIVNVLPDKKYEKYLGLFMGAVFLMLVVSPFASLSGVEDQLAEAFSRLTFQNDARMLKKEIEDADGERMRKLAEHYEDTIEAEVQVMAEAAEIRCADVHIEVDKDVESGKFGQMTAAVLTIERRSEGEEEAEQAAEVGNERRGEEDQAAETMVQISELCRRIGEYYGLEEHDIEIRFKDE